MEENFVINIGRQLGSGGKSIGKLLALRLGVPLYDRQLIDLAARESGLCPECFERVDEQRAHSLYTTLVNYLRAPFTGYEGGAAGNVLSNEALFKVQSDVIRDLASRQSCIFVGRCADYILRDRTRCVNLFITADRGDRIARLCAELGIGPDEAGSLMERTDRCRAAYYDYFTSRRWGRAATYDLCLNSSVLGDEGSAEFLLAFAARKLNLKF